MLNQVNKREKNIDLFKAVLVICMIFSHVLALISQNSGALEKFIIWYTSLVSFSGFLFCFGYSTNIAYLNKEKKEIKIKLLKNSIRLLVVFYLSGISYEILVANNIDISDILKILILWKIPKYSEFLASFAVLNLFILILYKYLKYIKDNNKIMLTLIIISLIFTFIPYKLINIPWLSLIIGWEGCCFPIIQYASLFLFGIYFSNNKPKFNLKTLLITIVLFIMYCICIKFKILTNRFPPGMFWIMGSYVFIYCYYYFTKKICEVYESNKIINIISNIGKSTLTFLLISNIIIFSLNHFLINKINFLMSIIITFIIICICYEFSKLKYHKSK